MTDRPTKEDLKQWNAAAAKADADASWQGGGAMAPRAAQVLVLIDEVHRRDDEIAGLLDTLETLEREMDVFLLGETALGRGLSVGPRVREWRNRVTKALQKIPDLHIRLHGKTRPIT